MSWVIAIIILVLCYFSIRRRLRIKSMTFLKEGASRTAVSPVSSPLADSIKELVGVAGGIYVAVTALASFLKITLPSKATIAGIEFDPIAAIAILIAVIQPYLSRRK